jgi:copper transport protein
MRRAALASAVLVGLLLPASAGAHSVLERAVPATQSRVEEPPSRVSLTFSEPLVITTSAVRVLAADGSILSGDATLSEDRRVVTVPVTGARVGESYTVRWRVTGVDAHSPAGVFTFGVGVAAPPPTDAVGASGTTTKDDVARWALFGALALLVGSLVVRLVVLRGAVVPAVLERRLHVVGVVGAFFVIDIGIAAFVLRASNALQLPVVDLLYGDLQPFAEQTRFGIAFLAMTLGFGVVAALLLVAWVFDASALRWAALALSVGLASGISLSGHQASEPSTSWTGQLADWVHLVSASIWVGGLATVALLVWPAAPALRRRAFLGFARLAIVLVGVLVVAGAYLAILRLPEVADLWETRYGQILLVKLALVALALTWGAAHHFVVRPRLLRGANPDVGPSLVGETVVAFSVLLAAAILTNVAPPPPAADAATAPVAAPAGR